MATRSSHSSRDTDQILSARPPPSPASAPSFVFPSVEEPLFEALRSAGTKKIILQLPAGLTRNAGELADRFRQSTGARVVLAARACFGACDFPSPEESGDADALVVLGHAPIPNVALQRPTYFVEIREARGDVGRWSSLITDAHLPKALGLLASIQHLEFLVPLARALAENGFVAEVAEGDRRLAYPGQALGCNYTPAERLAPHVEGFLFLGTGLFHPLGLAQVVEKPVWYLDPVRNELEGPIDRVALIRDRQLLVAQTMDAHRFGILVSTFAGQNRNSTAVRLQAKAREHGKEAEILIFGRLDPSDLLGRDFDAYVNTACPRIALDDYRSYPRPMLTVPEFLMALGELPLAPYRFDTYH